HSIGRRNRWGCGNRRYLAAIAYSEVARHGRRRWALFIRRAAVTKHAEPPADTLRFPAVAGSTAPSCPLTFTRRSRRPRRRGIATCSRLITGGNPYAFYNLGNACARKGEVDAALPDFNKAIPLDVKLAAAA